METGGITFKGWAILSFQNKVKNRRGSVKLEDTFMRLCTV